MRKSIQIFVTLAVLFTLLMSGNIFPQIQQPRVQGIGRRELGTSKKLRHKLSNLQRFERTLSKSPGEDPVFPVVMHSIERYLNRETDLSDIDKIIYGALKRHPGLTREILKKWVINWKALPDSTKVKFVPAELRNLSPSKKLNLMVFRNAFSRSFKQLDIMKKIGGTTKPPSARILTTQIPHLPRLELAPSATSTATITGIQPTEPDGAPWVYLGQPFTIYGKDFSTNNQENAIGIFRVVGGVDQPGITIYPTKSEPEKLEVLAPPYPDMAEGDYYIYVQVKDKGYSNLFGVHFGRPPLPPPVVSSITPSSQYSGKIVLINGSNIGENPRIWWQALDPFNKDAEGYGPSWTDVERLSDTQIKITVPDVFVYFPGNYLIAVSGDNQGISNWVNITIRPFKYRVQFTKMECLDESDPEWAGEDEVATQWAIACDSQAYSKGSDTYEFDDGVIRAYHDSDKVVFVPGGDAGVVLQYLFIGTALWEIDSGDAQGFNEALGFMGDVAKGIGSLFGGAGKTAGEIIGYVLKGLGKLISWLGGNPDGLGEKYLTWTVTDLRDKTNNNFKRFSDILEFLNNDDTGSYRLYYTVYRVEE